MFTLKQRIPGDVTQLQETSVCVIYIQLSKCKKNLFIFYKT